MHFLRNFTSVKAFLAAALVLGAAPAVPAADETFGRTPADLAMEDFLLHAEVVDVENVGEGITHPKRLTLRRGGEEHRAIFKNVDVEIDGPIRADRWERDFSDKYTYEVAAYRLDRLTGIGLVPVTVEREIDGEAGSVQLWIEDAITLEEAVADPTAEVENYDLLVERLGLMYVLDALIYNVDRNFGNVLVDLDRDIFHPIDHSRAFRLSPKPPPSVRGATDKLTLSDEIDQRLRGLDLETLRQLVGDLLEENQVRAILKRRDRLVKMLDKRAA